MPRKRRPWAWRGALHREPALARTPGNGDRARPRRNERPDQHVSAGRAEGWHRPAGCRRRDHRRQAGAVRCPDVASSGFRPCVGPGSRRPAQLQPPVLHDRRSRPNVAATSAPSGTRRAALLAPRATARCPTNMCARCYRKGSSHLRNAPRPSAAVPAVPERQPQLAGTRDAARVPRGRRTVHADHPDVRMGKYSGASFADPALREATEILLDAVPATAR